MTQAFFPEINWRFDYGYDNAGRQISLIWNTNRPVVDNYRFNHHGSSAVEIINYANGVEERNSLDNRRQTAQRVVRDSAGTVLMSLSYNFRRPSDGKNTGNVYSIDYLTDIGWDQDFAYDYLNRLTSFSSPAGGNCTYSYDRYGNRNSSCMNLGFSPANNRITTSGYSYDVAGNLTAEPGNRTYQYNAENRIKSVNHGSVGVYSYDAEGRRVKRVANGQTRYYFYDVNGQPVLEVWAGIG